MVPVSLDGTHDLANLAAAHLECNIKKGNRSLGPEQLRLVAW
jgi:5-methylcytosine-specific restriction endonuclease McrA